MSKKIVAIVGSYRKGGTVDTVVEAVLAGAREHGAATQTIYLTEQRIEFCQNCRTCTQTPGEVRGKCPQHDDLAAILSEIDAADSVVLGAPVNCYNVTAIFRRFLERLLGACYWPWGQPMPHMREKVPWRKAVLVTSAAMPGLLIPLFTGATKALRVAASMLQAQPVGSLCIGLAAGELHHDLKASTLQRARRLGARLAV